MKQITAGPFARRSVGVAPASDDDSTHDAPIHSGSSRILPAINSAAGVCEVTFDGDINYCTPVVDTYHAGSGIDGSAYAFSSNTATVFTWYIDSAGNEVRFSYHLYIQLVC